MVAKDTKWVQSLKDDMTVLLDSTDKRDFHKVFCKTQLKAKMYAKIFNEKVALLPHVNTKLVPKIEFLDCSVYMIETREGRQGYLVEKMLDIKQFEYVKWNNNAGKVVDTANGQLKSSAGLQFIAEEDEDYDSDYDSDNNDSNVPVNSGQACGFGKTPDSDFSIDDIPQAFSCFSYWEFKRRFLICDLQGILNTSAEVPLFERTDPVIHHCNSEGTRPKYGRSHKGISGFVSFFDTQRVRISVGCWKPIFLLT